MAHSDTYEPAIPPTNMTLRQRFYNYLTVVTPAELKIYREALMLTPSPHCNIITIAKYMTDLGYQYNRLAIEIAPTARGIALARMARTLNQRAHDIMWENPSEVPDKTPQGTMETLQPFTGPILSTNGPSPIIPPLNHPHTQLTGPYCMPPIHLPPPPVPPPHVFTNLFSTNSSPSNNYTNTNQQTQTNTDNEADMQLNRAFDRLINELEEIDDF